MSFLKRLYKNSNPQYKPEVMSEVERAGALRDNAIEYIVSLPKSDKDRFYDAVELIWQGYDKLNRVKTKDEKAIDRETKALGILNDPDDLGFDLLDDDPSVSSPLKTNGGSKNV